MATPPGELELELKRVFPAEPSRVYRFFSEPAKLAAWWGPRGFRIGSVDFHPRAGATYRIEMQPPDGDPFHLTGSFQEVVPADRLAFTFRWEPPDPDDVETLADISFRDFGDATELVLEQGGFKTEARLEVHRGGWNDSLDKLERLVSAHAPG
jgi:uncharacterized protein YndB with AHSA1/START domain